MGRLNLRRNVGQKIVIQSPLGTLDVQIDTANEHTVALSFEGSADYSVFREEVRDKALQNFGSYPAEYPLYALKDTIWGKKSGFYVYDLRDGVINSEFKYLYHLPKVYPLVVDSYCGSYQNVALIERDLKEYKVMAGVQSVVILHRITSKAYVLKLNVMTPYAMLSFCNSLSFRLDEKEIVQLGFQLSTLTSKDFNLVKVDLCA